MHVITRVGQAIVARARARAQSRRGVTIGPGTRFGKRVTCRAAPGGEVVIGRNVEIAPYTSLFAGPGGRLEIGDGVFVGGWCNVAASGNVSIGSESMLAEWVTVRDHDHDPALPPKSGQMLQSDVVIGCRVWIAAKASIGRGVTVGNDAVIGAHAFVNGSVPADCLVAGVPARIVREGIKRQDQSAPKTSG